MKDKISITRLLQLHPVMQDKARAFIELLERKGFNPHDHDLGIGLLGLFSNALIGVISFYFGQKGIPTTPPQDNVVHLQYKDSAQKMLFTWMEIIIY